MRRGWRTLSTCTTTPASQKRTPRHQRRHRRWLRRTRLASAAGRTYSFAAKSAGCGAKYGRIDGDFAIKGNTLTLANGLIDTGFARLKANGEWVNAPGNERTSLKGSLHGSNLDTAAGFFGISTPIQNASFNVDYDLHWRNPPGNLRKPRSTGFYVRVWVKASLLISVAVMPDSYCGCSVLMRCCVSCGLTSEIPLARALFRLYS